MTIYLTVNLKCCAPTPVWSFDPDTVGKLTRTPIKGPLRGLYLSFIVSQLAPRVIIVFIAVSVLLEFIPFIVTVLSTDCAGTIKYRP